MIGASLKIPTDASGADLVGLIRLCAKQRGVSEASLFSQLSRHPDTWRDQLAIAKRPKPATIARVEALLAGREIPSPPPKKFQTKCAFGGGKAAIEEVCRRRELGQGPTQIAEETGIAPAVVRQAFTRSADSAQYAARRNMRSGSKALLEAVHAECAKRAERLKEARTTGGMLNPLDCDRETPIARFDPSMLLDVRPFATGREPCPRCGIRGDIGCRHQRAAEQSPILHLEQNEND
ncbi:hypothetical protein [Novosphingobium aquimarinum]|uniref:hypothetical protein n=1 Tax=Novosphingobium aquimarinum TaxID=2682494 RepID=UPI0012EB1E6D|nr:hypothetical protein [Novosphingobium aquimarinum]